MPAYDSETFTPPAPLARVVVRTPDHAKSIAEVPMLIDSGTDVTLILRTCAERLGLEGEPQEESVLVGFDGSTSSPKAVYAELLFLGGAFRGRFPITDDQVGILGRNVLNHLSLVLDGPRLNWREGP
jgi:hypothetical protein